MDTGMVTTMATGMDGMEMAGTETTTITGTGLKLLRPMPPTLSQHVIHAVRIPVCIAVAIHQYRVMTPISVSIATIWMTGGIFHPSETGVQILMSEIPIPIFVSQM
jgi:hypothetical protein